MARSRLGGVALLLAGVCALAWVLACAKSTAKPAAEATGSPAAQPAAPAPDPMAVTREQLVAYGNGAIDLATFHAVADAQLGANAGFWKDVASNCAGQPAGQPRNDCLRNGEQVGANASSWGANAQPRP